MKISLSALVLSGLLAGFPSLASAAEPDEDSAKSGSEKSDDDAPKGEGEGEGGSDDAPKREGPSMDGGDSSDKVDDSERKIEPPKSDKEEKPTFGHGKQFGLRAALVVPYRMILRYDDSPYCTEYQPAKQPKDQPKFCGFVGPVALDLALSAALIDFFEPFLWARFGFAEEKKTNTAPLMLFGAGARLYTMADDAFKIYVEPALGVEVERVGTSTDTRITNKLWRTDLIFHLAAGPQFDITKNFGVYADAGLTLGILRSLGSTLEAKLGVQGRIP